METSSPAAAPAALRLERQLCFAYSANLAMGRLYRGLLRELDLT